MLMQRIISVALKEYQSGIRNKIILFLTILMAGIALVISYFGSAGTGHVGIENSSVVIVSLVSLSVYILPIVSLVLGHDLIVGELEGKTLSLLLTLPISRGELYLGKFLGQALSIVTVTTIGMGVVGPFFVFKQGFEILGPFVKFLLCANLLSLCFLSLAQMSSAIVSERVKSIGISLFFWFFFVLIFDLVLIGLLVVTDGHVDSSLFSFLLFLNPTDIFRVVNLIGMDEAKGSFGLITLAKDGSYVFFAYASFLLWVLVPLVIGSFIFKRRDF